MEIIKSGKIISLYSNNYLVKLEDDSIVSAKAKGRFRKEGISPLVGDNVELLIEENDGRSSEVTINKIKERKNTLDRPNVANIDNALILMSIHAPELSTLLIDKFIFNVSYAGIRPYVILTKSDLLNNGETEELNHKIAVYEKLGIKTFLITSKNNDFYEEISKLLENKYSVVVGQTGVGKSTFINHFKPQLSKDTAQLTIGTQEISKALGRGKHTTRTATIYELVNGIKIIDTPGFSSLEVNVDTIDFANHFSMLNFGEIRCKFSNCLHKQGNSGCKVVEAVDAKTMEPFLYKNYLKILEEMISDEY